MRLKRKTINRATRFHTLYQSIHKSIQLSHTLLLDYAFITKIFAMKRLKTILTVTSKDQRLPPRRPHEDALCLLSLWEKIKFCSNIMLKLLYKDRFRWSQKQKGSTTWMIPFHFIKLFDLVGCPCTKCYHIQISVFSISIEYHFRRWKVNIKRQRAKTHYHLLELNVLPSLLLFSFP